MISEEIHKITDQLPEGVRLVAVSKFHPSTAIREAFAAGQTLFGESHAQELQRKHEELAELAPLEWHFIGHLQTNKVKYIAPYVALIHATDTPHLLAEIDKQGQKCGRIIPCLLQLHVAQEESKFGFTPDEALAFLDEGTWQQLAHVQLSGVMAMASNTDDSARVRDDFRRARRFFEQAQSFFPATEEGGRSPFAELSMGMSEDWHIAIDEGATLIRIGTQIFGERQY
ncbi:MAG: YggS family pyridoxal phosphate-dependent enzyme [Bacteroidaceae bacterium]|nr:YggS family pyridoxal phosphate-dependent enzyme [Bacteroidaceae bacterium]